MASTPSRTFTAPLTRVKNASIAALKRMGIQTTRMRVVARNGGFFYGGATAAEIIQQTRRSLGV